MGLRRRSVASLHPYFHNLLYKSLNPFSIANHDALGSKFIASLLLLPTGVPEVSSRPQTFIHRTGIKTVIDQRNQDESFTKF